MGLPALRPQWGRLDIQRGDGGCNTFGEDKYPPVSTHFLGQYFQVFDLLDKTMDDTEDLDRVLVKQRVGLVWQALDKENDGLISQESFVAFCQQLHKQRE